MNVVGAVQDVTDYKRLAVELSTGGGLAVTRRGALRPMAMMRCLQSVDAAVVAR